MYALTHTGHWLQPEHLLESEMNGQEAFRRFAQQLQRVQQSRGSRMPGGNRGLFAGGGLLVALVGGGLALNASLFNGMHSNNT